MIKMGEEMVDCKTEIDIEASAAEGLYPAWPIQFSSSLFIFYIFKRLKLRCRAGGVDVIVNSSVDCQKN